jgi:hypothetical protein
MSAAQAAGGKRSRSRSRDRDDKRRDEKKMKKHKHKDRSRSREKDRHKDKHRDRDPPMDDFIDDADAKRRDKMKKFREAEEYHRKEDDYDPVAPRKAFPSQGTVTAHENIDGPTCFKCGQICKDNALLKNHVLSHYYQDFYRVTPDCKPFACPDCGKENRDRITMIRHYAYTHNMIHELTDVTPADLNSTGRGGRGAVTALHKPRGDKKEKEVKRYGDSDDDDKKFKERMAQGGAMTFGKHPKEHKPKKEKKNKEHKKDETEEERRIRKDKKRAEKEKDRSERKSKDGGGTALSSMLKELTPDSPAGPSEPRRRIAHAQRSEDNSPDGREEREEEPAAGPGQPAAGQEDESDDDFGDLPAPVFAE